MLHRATRPPLPNRSPGLRRARAFERRFVRLAAQATTLDAGALWPAGRTLRWRCSRAALAARTRHLRRACAIYAAYYDEHGHSQEGAPLPGAPCTPTCQHLLFLTPTGSRPTLQHVARSKQQQMAAGSGPDPPAARARARSVSCRRSKHRCGRGGRRAHPGSSAIRMWHGQGRAVDDARTQQGPNDAEALCRPQGP